MPCIVVPAPARAGGFVFAGYERRLTAGLLLFCNAFITRDGYGQQNFREPAWLQQAGVFTLFPGEPALAFFLYDSLVPAGRSGLRKNSGPFSFFCSRRSGESLHWFLCCMRGCFSGANTALIIKGMAALLLVGAVHFAFR